jgi:hypothetical protein
VRGNWLRVQAYGANTTRRRNYDQKVSMDLIVFRGKCVDNKIILKWRVKVSRDALVNLG